MGAASLPSTSTRTSIFASASASLLRYWLLATVVSVNSEVTSDTPNMRSFWDDVWMLPVMRVCHSPAPAAAAFGSAFSTPIPMSTLADCAYAVPESTTNATSSLLRSFI